MNKLTTFLLALLSVFIDFVNVFLIASVLYFQEDTLAIEYVEKHPAHGDVSGACEEWLSLFGQ